MDNMNVLPGGLQELEMIEKDLEFAYNQEENVSGSVYDIEFLSTLDKDSLYEYLKDKLELLVNKDIQNLIMEDRNYYCFVWLIRKKGSKIFEYFPESEMIPFILKSERSIDKIAVVLDVGGALEFFTPEILKIILDNDELLFYLYHLTEESANIVFEYMLNNKKIHLFGELPIACQKKILSTNIFKILSNDLSKNFFYRLNDEVLNFLCNFDKVQEFILNSDIKFIDKLVKKGILFPYVMIKDKRFKKFYLNITDPVEYRFYIMNLEKNNNLGATLIDEIRRKNYDKIYKNYTEEKLNEKIDNIIFKKKNDEYYEDLVNDRVFWDISGVIEDEEIVEIIKNDDTIYMKDIIIDRFFGEVSINFLKNLKVMMDYIKSLSKEIIPKERIEIYNKLLNFDDMSILERKEFYFEMLKYGSFEQIFYGDYRLCRDRCYTELKNSVIDLKECEKYKNESYSAYAGVPVYNFNGQKFAAFVHNTSRPRTVEFKWNENSKLEGLSLSYITDKNINVFHNPNESIVFGFSNLDISRILHLRNTDSFSNYSQLLDDFSEYIQHIYTPEKLVEETLSYNEILYQNINMNIPEIDKKIRPDYVVCYDTIENGDILTAKTLNIPIVLIDSKVYGRAKSGIDENIKNKYVTGIDSARMSRLY